MERLKRPVIIILIVISAALFTACSQNTYNTRRTYGHASAPHIDPVSHKKYPLRKNYIVPVKRKEILGLKKPKI
ncbi:MAG: hypothetical protein B6D64_10720 [Bacteroidetes bacterium 4484_276]|nr:MAG: hypothetical protein B6D64_10720 [Bacteroidetes bacterium 4484_276]